MKVHTSPLPRWLSPPISQPSRIRWQWKVAIIAGAVFAIWQCNAALQFIRSAALRRVIEGLPDMSAQSTGAGLPIWYSETNGMSDRQKSEALASLTSANLLARRQCIERNSCVGKQEKIIFIHDPHHLSVAGGEKFGGGEKVWARSSLRALQALNYTLVYHSVPDEQISSFVLQTYGSWDAIEFVFTNQGTAEKCGRDPTCYFSHNANPTGAPLWKLFVFYLWAGTPHPLGGEWVMKIEDVYSASERRPYLGYSIDECLQRDTIPASMRYGSQTYDMAQGARARIEQLDFDAQRRAAYILAKDAHYLDTHMGVWEEQAFRSAYEHANVRFEMGGLNSSQPIRMHGANLRVPEWANDRALLQNHNLIRPREFEPTLGAMSLLVGLGHPMLSPTPYQALCMGVPFINPIHDWQRSDPLNRNFWRTQHNGLLDLDPPYVYHVHRNNTHDFVRAVQRALEHPAPRYVPERMRQEAVTRRMKAILEADYRGVAKRNMADRQQQISRGMKAAGPVYDIA